MPVFLLDANVLIALAWPNHRHHQLAYTWFDAHRGQGWATCPFTECAFIRISMNSRAVQEKITVDQAAELLRKLTALPAHSFWTDDLPVVEMLTLHASRLRGHQQVTDLYLLTLATRYGGQLATLDRALHGLPDVKAVE